MHKATVVAPPLLGGKFRRDVMTSCDVVMSFLRVPGQCVIALPMHFFTNSLWRVSIHSVDSNGANTLQILGLRGPPPSPSEPYIVYIKTVLKLGTFVV